ncbi:ABC transporter permease [Acetobacteraceae bacterium H6797]|nr:ABC transporter permease [Acetobacteraceae bacterium H6797]
MKALRSDLLYDFTRTPAAVFAAALLALLLAGAALAPWIAPHDPFDLAAIQLTDAFHPPAWSGEGEARFPLGTDGQGRDMLSAMLFGLRLSLAVGLGAVALSALLGIAAGLCAGYLGGLADALLMRLADIQLTFPSILVALLIDGVIRAALPPALHEELALPIVILAVGLSNWPHFARTVRASTLVERDKEYVQAARLIGVPRLTILTRHLLPNVLGPVFVIATLNLGFAIIAEATLSFLGVGVPASRPSLGTLIRLGNDFLFSGEWWILLLPACLLVLLVLAVNLLGDWLRDALNPRLR